MMARKSTRPRLVLTPEEVKLLEELRQSRTAPWRKVQRARVLWLYYCGETIAAIMKGVRMTRKSVARTTGASRNGGLRKGGLVLQ